MDNNTFEYLEEYKHPVHILLNVTDACNLACRYCFVEQHPHYMTLDIAKKAADWVISNFKWKKERFNRKDIPSIYFFGGEPTLQFDTIIKPLVSYCEEIYPDIKIKFGMTTNATLLTSERIQYMANKNFSLLLSIDGDKYTQDYNRPCHDGSSSFDLISLFIPELLNKFPNLTFRSTIFAETAQYLYKNYLFAENQNFLNYFAIPDSRHPWTEEQMKILQQEVQKIFIHRTNEFLCNVKPLRVSIIDEMFEWILQHDEQFILQTNTLTHRLSPNKNIYRCGLGVSGCSIAYDGSIYGCQEQPSKGHSSFFYIGNILNEGISQELHTKLLEKYYFRDNMTCADNSQCNINSCPLFSVCYLRDCPSTSYDLYQDFSTEHPIRCFWKKIIFENCTTMMKILTDQNCQLFKKYLSNLHIYPKYMAREVY